MSKRKTIGLALGSGGPRGLAHVGVIKTLLKHNIHIDYIAGSSIGAWIAVHYGLYQDIKKLEEYTVHKKKDKFYVFLEPTLKGGFVKGTKMHELLKLWLKDKSFSDTKIPVSVVATDLITGKPIMISKGKLAEAARASMSVPTLFKPLIINEQLLIDGGSSNPVPDDVVKKMGADIVISVNLDNYHKNSSFNINNLTLTKTANRTFEIMRHYLAQYSIKDSDFIIEPNIPAIGIMSWPKYFREEIGPKIVKIGEKETEKIIDDLKKVL
ncbi:patatin-like phospholipase family protein [Patescibacteria group bacterium]|nr:patatin-like phospholipase family protein [Patescibacteria group bacterium]